MSRRGDISGQEIIAKHHGYGHGQPSGISLASDEYPRFCPKNRRVLNDDWTILAEFSENN